jgi:drug/metabolite transporter (DMT)-like permease
MKSQPSEQSNAHSIQSTAYSKHPAASINTSSSTPQRKSYFSVHIAVLLFGMTGLFGKFLTLSPFIIVLGRVFFSAIFIGLWMRIKRESFALETKRDYAFLAAMGTLLAVHWVSFFGAIQLSTVAVGLLTFSTFPVFVSLFKPFLQKAKIEPYEIVVGLFACIGIYLVVPSDGQSGSLLIGALTGVFSGAVYAVFTTYNEHLVRRYTARTVAFYEQIFATVLLLPFFFILQPIITVRDIGLLILLGTVFTGIGHTLFISGLKGVTAHTAAMITMLEPLYAIILSAVTLHESVSMRTIIGGTIILTSVAVISIIKKSAS